VNETDEPLTAQLYGKDNVCITGQLCISILSQKTKLPTLGWW